MIGKSVLPKQLKHSELPELREQLLQEQNGMCPICARPVENPVVDHHHTKRIKGTGKVRAVLCRTCNVLLAKVENNCNRYCVSQEELPHVLRRMAKYLEQPQLNIIHPTELSKQPILMKSSYNELKKEINNKQKIPAYPRSGKLTKVLAKLFAKYQVKPKFYK